MSQLNSIKIHKSESFKTQRINTNSLSKTNGTLNVLETNASFRRLLSQPVKKSDKSTQSSDENCASSSSMLPPPIGFIMSDQIKPAIDPKRAMSVKSSSSCKSEHSYTENSYENYADLDTNSSVNFDKIRNEPFSKKELINSRVIHFWDIGGYKAVLERCDNGCKLSDDLKKMIEKRAKLEKDYANSIKKWCEEWNNYLENCEEYGETMKSGWHALIESGNKTADIHIDVARKLAEEPKSPVKKLEKYKRENYQRRTFKVFSLKKTHEFRTSFIESQQHWADLQLKLRISQKEYDKAVKANKSQRKEMEKLKTCQKEIHLYKPIYVARVKEVYEETQKFEAQRMDQFKDVFQEFHDILKVNGDERFEKVFQVLNLALDRIDTKKDLDEWSENYGAGTELHLKTNNL